MALFGIGVSPTILSFTDLNGNDGEFSIDASISIVTSLKAKVTSYPVQGKKFLSDHVQADPLQLKLEGEISQSPSSFLQTLASGILGNAVSQISNLSGLSSTFATAAVASGIAGVSSLINSADEDANFANLLTDRSSPTSFGDNDNDYPKRAMQGMISMFRTGTPFKVRTFFDNILYDNMVMTSLTFPQDAKTGDSLRFTLQCVKINTVESTFNALGGKPEMRATDPAGGSAAPKQAKGTLTGKATPPQAEADESFIASWFL